MTGDVLRAGFILLAFHAFEPFSIDECLSIVHKEKHVPYARHARIVGFWAIAKATVEISICQPILHSEIPNNVLVVEVAP